MTNTKDPRSFKEALDALHSSADRNGRLHHGDHSHGRQGQALDRSAANDLRILSKFSQS